MMTPLWWCRAGQRVVCVKSGSWDTYPIYDGDTDPVEDGVYTIRDVVVHSEYGVGLRFEELRNPVVPMYQETAYQAIFFRPVRETSIESLRALLSSTPADAPQLEDA